MSTLPISNISDTEEDVMEDEDEELRFQESIKKDLFSEFTSATPMKVSRVSVSHSREPMKVYLRVRPFTNTEVEDGESQDCMLQENSNTLLMQAPKNSFAFKSSQRGLGEMNHKFTFSKIFDEEASQKMFFDETMLSTVKDFIDGHNCLVFTYGVTNAGKTYTIQGVPQDGGILPRALDVIFNSIEDKQFYSNRLKPRYFCDVVKLSEKQQKKEEDVKSSVLSLSNVPSTSVADQTTMLEGESMTNDSLNTDISRASYSATNDDSQDSSKLSDSKMSMSKDCDAVSNQTFLDEVNARIPDDTVVNVDAQGPIKFSVWVSFAEIYNEYMYDLLEPLPKEKKIRRQALKLSEDKKGSIYIKGLKQIQVNSADEAYRILKIGQRNLSIAATKLNHCSSRSHCIFSIKILRVVDVEDPHVARVSHLSFCDLAGSERYTRTHNTGERLKEAGNINTSLLTLGKCIHALRYNQNHPKAHPKIIPFRESKLTRLFQSFFLGKGKASMVVNVNQCASGFDETMHVLKFSAIAKQVTTVTSKLDNKWKEKPKLRPLRNVSLALNQALDCKVKGQRPSVPWATPGTIAQVMKETGQGPSMEDTVFEVDEEEEEDMEEEEEEGEGDEEGDVAVTPIPKKDENAAKIQKDLLAVIEVLKQKLVEEKTANYYLETKIREEVCQEMAEQLVEIEQDYNERLEEDKQRAEELYEKRLEIYTKSVKKSRTRGRTQNDEDTEQVSASLLTAEQNKVKDRDAEIEKLNADLESTEKSLKEFEDSMHTEVTELKKTIAEQTKCLEENEAKFSMQEKEFLESQEILTNQITELKEAIAQQARCLEEKEANITSQEKQFLESQEATTNQISELNQTIENQKRQLEEKETNFGSHEKELIDGKECLQKQISELNQTIADQNIHLQKKEAEYSEVRQELQDTVESFEKRNDETNRTIEESNRKIEALEQSLLERIAEIAMYKKEQNEGTGALQEQIADLTRQVNTQDKSLEEKENQFKTRETELVHSKEALQEQIADLTGQVDDQKRSLEEKEDQFKARETELVNQRDALEEQVTRLTKQLEDQEKSLEEKEKQLKNLETELIESKEALQQQVSALENTVDGQRSRIADMEAKFESDKEGLTQELEKQIDDLHKTVRKQTADLKEAEERILVRQKNQHNDNEFLHEQIDELNTVIDVQKDQLSKKTDTIDMLQKEVEARKVILAEKIEELTSVIEKQKRELKEQSESLELKTKEFEELATQQHKDMEEHETLVHDLEQRMEVLAGAEKQIADAKKEIAEQEIQIGDLYEQLEESKAKVKQTEETMAAQLCAEIKMHEEAQKEMRSTILKNTNNETEAKRLLEEQEVSIEDLKKAVERKEKLIRKMEEKLHSRDEHLKEMERRLEEANQKTPVEECHTQTDESLSSSENTTTSSSSYSSASSASSEESVDEGGRKLTGLPSTTSLASTISSASTEDDDSIIIIEPEDQEGYKAGRLSRVEIDATPLQKKNSRKGRAAKVTKTSLRSSRKRAGGDDDQELEGGKKLKREDSKPKGRTRRATRASSKSSLHEEIENQPEDGSSPATVSQSGSSSRRGPLARINEYLQNSPIGKSVLDTAKRLVDSATGASSESSAEAKPPSPSPPKAVEMDTFVPSMVPERRRKRKLYKADISAPFEASPHEMISRQCVGEAKTTEGSVTVITRKLRSRTKKTY